MQDKKITFNEVEYWLGTDEGIIEAIQTLVDIANGEYKLDTFKRDVIETNQQKEV